MFLIFKNSRFKRNYSNNYIFISRILKYAKYTVFYFCVSLEYLFIYHIYFIYKIKFLVETNMLIMNALNLVNLNFKKTNFFLE